MPGSLAAAESTRVPRRRTSRAARRRSLTPYFLITPAFAVLGLILLYPLVVNTYYSLTDFNLTRPSDVKLVGLRNFVVLFHDAEFRSSLVFTLMFTLLTIILGFALALGSALLLQSFSRIRQLLAMLTLLPYTIAAIAAGLIWRLLWSNDIGLVNYLLSLVGIRGPAWLASENPAIVAVIISEVWRSTPFLTILLLAALVAQPVELKEAARVDGAGSWRTFLHITFPMILPTAMVGILFETVFKLRVFDLIFLLTQGGPGTATMPVGILVYRTYFRYLDGGLAAAMAVVLTLLGLALSFAYTRILERWSDFS